jgi:capsule polysaccharide export protein KpsE/RkpR
MSATGVKPTPAPVEPEVLEPGRNGHDPLSDQEFAAAADRQAQLLRLVWNRRRFLFRLALATAMATSLITLLIPNSYTSTAQLMPPDSQSASSMAMLAAMAAKAGPGLATMAGDFLGVKSSGALFIGVLRSETSQDRIIDRFNLQKVYSPFGKQLLVDTRKKLDENTTVSEDRKSGIISISVTDHSAQRASDIANAYVDQLNSLVAELSTSAAHRERVFLEGRLKVAKVELDDAANSLAQFSSKNGTLDIQTEGKAMLDAASILAGQMIAAQAELEGLRQIYTDNNGRVKALSAHVAELRRQLEKLGGVDAAAPENSSNATVAAGSGSQPSPTPDLATGRIGSLPFPTIKNLPLLGAKYSDYYRRAKIEETVYELLTQQYELAKVEEAKEIPSVKVLDPAKVPERKSFPPRLLIVLLITFMVTGSAVLWTFGAHNWEQTAANDPRKILAQEIAATVRARLPWTTSNGAAFSHVRNGDDSNSSSNGDAVASGNAASGSDAAGSAASGASFAETGPRSAGAAEEQGGTSRRRTLWQRIRGGNGSNRSGRE